VPIIRAQSPRRGGTVVGPLGPEAPDGRVIRAVVLVTVEPPASEALLDYISSRSDNIIITRTAGILSHRTAKIKCYDRLSGGGAYESSPRRPTQPARGRPHNPDRCVSTPLQTTQHRRPRRQHRRDRPRRLV